jgi:hypothetical protein
LVVISERRRRCKDLVDSLEIPSPFDLGEFVAAVAKRRGRPIVLREMALPRGGMCGLVVSAPAQDLIVYAKHTSRTHQRHIVSHELAHLLLEHGTDPETSVQASQAALPHLDPAMVKRVLAGRSNYEAVHEEEAELVASLITLRVSGWSARPRHVAAWHSTQDAVADRVMASFRARHRQPVKSR